MKHLIDKDALVAEIKRRIKGLEDCHADTVAGYDGEISGLKRLLSFIDTLEVKEVDLEKELETPDSLLYHNAIIKQSAIIDSQPKNTCFPVPKGEEYKHMCMSLAQGYEMDWVDHYAEIIVNEFGKPESFDSFKKRHPNFAEDIRNAFLNYQELSRIIIKYQQQWTLKT